MHKSGTPRNMKTNARQDIDFIVKSAHFLWCFWQVKMTHAMHVRGLISELDLRALWLVD